MFWLFVIQIVLIALNAVFASAEIAVLSINEATLEHMANEGNKKAKRLFRLTKEPAKFLATIQVAITLSGFLGSAFAADSFSEPLVAWAVGLGLKWPVALIDTIAVVLITLVLSYFTLVFGELVPKRLAMKRSEQIAMGISGMVSGISVVFRPLVWLLSASTDLVLRICGIDPNEAEDNVSEEEIRMLVDAGTEKGTIDHHEKEFIQNVFEFNDITAADIATRRADVIHLYLGGTDAEWELTVMENRHSFYPICDGSIDNIVAVLCADDYFRLSDRSHDAVMENATVAPYYVPENIKADVLFRNMKSTHNSMAIVIDEYGGVTGIATFYDLIEELVGEIYADEDGEEKRPHLEKIDEFTYRAVGNIPLEELSEIGLVIESEDYDTLAGVVFDALGSIPDDGEAEIPVELEHAHVLIKRVSAHQLDETIITIDPPEPDAEEEK